MIMKKSELLQASATNNFEKKTQSGVIGQQTGAQQSVGVGASGISLTDSHGKDKSFQTQLASLKIEQQHSGITAKQLKIQQLYSDQASKVMQQNIQTHGLGSAGHHVSISPRVGQGITSIQNQSTGVGVGQNTSANVAPNSLITSTNNNVVSGGSNVVASGNSSNAWGGGGERQENSGAAALHQGAYQIVQSRQQQIKVQQHQQQQAAQAAGANRPQFNKMTTAASAGLHVFERKGGSSWIIPGSTKNEGGPSGTIGSSDKGNVGISVPSASSTAAGKVQQASEIQQKQNSQSSAFHKKQIREMRSRSPHGSNFLQWGSKQSVTQKNNQAQANPQSKVSGVGLALKMMPISDSKRQQSSVVNPTSSGSGPQIRGTSYGPSVWNNASQNIMVEGGPASNSTIQQLQRAAGKPTGAYTQNEHGNFIVDSSNGQSHWKSSIEWMQSDEKVAMPANSSHNNNANVSTGNSVGNNNIFTQGRKQQHMNFNHTGLKAMQSTFGTSRENFMNQAPTGGVSQTGGVARSQFNSFMNTPSQSKYLQQSRLNITKEDSVNATNNPTIATNELLDTNTNPNNNNTKSFKLSAATSTSGANIVVGSTTLNNANGTSNANIGSNETDQFKVSGGFSGFHRGSMDAQQAKPQLVQNQGMTMHKRIPNRIMNKGKQHVMQDTGLTVMGRPIMPDQQQLHQTTQQSIQQHVVGGDLSATEDLTEMTTPDQNKDKFKKRMIVGQLESGSSIMKAPIHGKAQMGSVFMSSQDHLLQDHKRMADDGSSNAHHHRRAESMGKQKLQSKFSNRVDEQHAGLEEFLQVKNFKQQTQELVGGGPFRGKKSKHNNSFQGGIRPKNNAPFKRIQTNSTTTSQLNDSGHGSGGNAPGSMIASSNIAMNDSSTKFGLNTTTLNSERDNHIQILQSSQNKTRRQPHGKLGPVIVLHPTIKNGSSSEMPQHPEQQRTSYYIPQQMSPAPNRSKQLIIQKQTSSDFNQVMSGGEKKMFQLHKQLFVDPQTNQNQIQKPPPSPKSSIKQTPQSNRKHKSKLVMRGDGQAPHYGGGSKTERMQQRKDEASIEEPHVIKESVKRKKLRNVIKQNKKIQDLNISSFASQERDGSQSLSSDEAEDVMPRVTAAKQPRVKKLQKLQDRNKENNMDSSSDDDLSREDQEMEGPGADTAMAIVQGFTPSGLASSNTQNKQSSSIKQESYNNIKNNSATSSSPQQIQETKEFNIGEGQDEVPMTNKKAVISNVSDTIEMIQHSSKSKDQKSLSKNSEPKEHKKMHPIFSKASLSKEKLRESENFSKYHSSSDSSFQQTFEQLLRADVDLKQQLDEIMQGRLSPQDPFYSDFIERIVAANQERQQKIFNNSMPLQRNKQHHLLENNFTKKRLITHIENQKRLRSENVYRHFHSDMSRSRFQSNSVREDHPSITSPNFSNTALGVGLRGLNLHYKHERKRRLHRYLSFSNGVTYHAKSAQQASFFLPELSGGRHRNSFNFGGRPFGISDSNSQRFQQIINSSNSNQTVPTPIRKENPKLEDLQDAAKQVQIVTPSNNNFKADNSALQQIDTTNKALLLPQQPQQTQPSNIHMIYEKLNMNDRKRAQINAAMPHLMPPKQQQKQENNFFPQAAQDEAIAEIAAAETQQACDPINKTFGKVLEWQMGNLLGQGTTGEVYGALNIDTGEQFAVKMIKLMHPYLGLDQQKLKSVKKEIQRYKLLKHRHIVKYYDSEIIENNVLCIYLEYMYSSIDQMCNGYDKIGENNVRVYTQQVLKALVYLHSKNVTHGDLKGANVLVSQDGKEIKLCDMGNSLLLKNAQQQFDPAASTRSLQSVQSLIASSPAWMAPETQNNKFGKKSDIWSLGCLVIEMLTGQNPWGTRLDGETNVHLALQRRIALNERPEIPSGVSVECQNFIERCLKHNINDRPHATELLNDPWIKNKEHSTIQSPRLRQR